MRLLPRLAPLFAAAALGCSDDAPTGITAGTEMTVAEQVAIEAALGRVAEALEEVGRTATDTLMADLTRVAARLVRLQGRQGALQLTGSAVPGGAAMQGVALVGQGEGLAALASAQLVVAWQGLDPVAFTVDRAIVTLGGGEGPPWSLAVTAADNAGRLIDFDGEVVTRFFYNSGGAFAAADEAFRGDCPGIPNTDEARCETGRQTVEGDVSGSADGGATTGGWAWESAVLPAFRLTSQ